MRAECWVAGELADAALRRAVLGADGPARPRMRDGYAVQAVPTGGRIVARAGARAELLCLGDLPEAARARLAYYQQAIGAQKLAEGVWGGPDNGGAAWDRGDWSALHWQLARALAETIMALYPHTSAAAIWPVLTPMRARVWSRVLAQQAPPQGRDVPPLADLRVAELAPLHLGFFRYDKVAAQVPQFDGTLSPLLHRELYSSADAALVLPYDPRRDSVLLLEQFRFGMWRRGDPTPWSLEPVAGMIDPGEMPEACARREAAEEAGLTLSALERITAGYASPGYSTAVFHMYAALCDLPDQGGRIGGVAAESENIRTCVMPFEQALSMAEQGSISVAPLQLMLFWLDRHRARLRGSVS